LILVFFGLVGLRAVEESTQRALAQQLVIAQLVADHVDQQLAAGLNILAHAANRLAPYVQDEDYEQLSSVPQDELSNLRPFSHRLLVLDEHGFVRVTFPHTPHLLDLSILDPSTIQTVRQTGQPFVSDLKYGRFAYGRFAKRPYPPTEPLVLMVAPMQDRSKRVVGFLCAEVLLRQAGILSFLRPLHAGEIGHVDLMDRQGTVLASTDPSMLFQKGDHASRFGELIAGQQPAVRGCHRCHEGPGTTTREDEIMAFAPLTVAPWGVALRQPAAEALAPVRQLRRQMFVGGAVILIAALFGVWITTSQVVRPLEALSQAAGQIAAGPSPCPSPSSLTERLSWEGRGEDREGGVDLPLRIRGAGAAHPQVECDRDRARRDEVGRLAQSFEEMRVRLQRMLERERQWSEVLEERVQERIREITALHAELQSKEEVRSRLLARLVSAQEEERKRIARELHDEVGQALTAVIMETAAVELALPEDSSAARAKLEAVRTIAGQALKDLRQLIFGLRPELLDDLGLVPAVRAYAREHLERHGVQVNLDSSGWYGRLPDEIEIPVFRVIQEAVTNIVRHARATEAWIRLRVTDSTLLVQIEDNGIGFDPTEADQVRPSGQGLGLRGMEERVNLLGGTLRIDSQPGQGTRITAQIPLSNLCQFPSSHRAGPTTRS
jgi:signal transduction histidine kinase